MYKQIGFSFVDALTAGQYETIKYTVLAIEKFYRSKDMTEYISEPGGRRMTARMRVTPALPKDLHISIWFMYHNRFRKGLVKDISVTGAGIILPFDDKYDVFNRDRPFTALLDLNTRGVNCWEKEPIICQSIVKYSRELDLKEEMKDRLKPYMQEVHPLDKYSGVKNIKQGKTIKYS